MKIKCQVIGLCNNKRRGEKNSTANLVANLVIGG